LLAILEYKSPATVPVVQGIDIVVCPDRLFGPSSPLSEPIFLAQLDTHDADIVFIRDLGVLNYDCSKRRESDKKIPADYPFQFVSNTVKWTSQARPRGGILTIAVRNAFTVCAGNDCLTSPALLEIVAPENDDYLAKTECGAGCFGASGLYKVSSYADGIRHFRLSPIPASSGMAEVYSCVLKKIAASNWLARFLACRW
jgi:hypothetical protein